MLSRKITDIREVFAKFSDTGCEIGPELIGAICRELTDCAAEAQRLEKMVLRDLAGLTPADLAGGTVVSLDARRRGDAAAPAPTGGAVA